MLVSLFGSAVADTIYFITHDHRAGHGEIHFPVINRSVRQLGGVEFVPLPFQLRNRLIHGGVRVGGDPVVAAAGGFSEGTETFPRPDHVHAGKTKRIAGADDGRQITGFVDLVGEDAEIGLASIQGLFDSGQAFGSHDCLSVLKNWKNQYYHKRFRGLPRQRWLPIDHPVIMCS